MQLFSFLFRKLRSTYLAKEIKIKITDHIGFKIAAKIGASTRLRFEDTKRIMSPEMHPKSFGTFENRAPEPQALPFSVLSRYENVKIERGGKMDE